MSLPFVLFFSGPPESVASNCPLEQMHTGIGCFWTIFSRTSFQMFSQIVWDILVAQLPRRSIEIRGNYARKSFYTTSPGASWYLQFDIETEIERNFNTTYITIDQYRPSKQNHFMLTLADVDCLRQASLYLLTNPQAVKGKKHAPWAKWS